MTVSPLWDDWFDNYFHERVDEMPPQTAKSALAAKLGARAATAHAKAKDKPVELDQGGRLPPGIENGVAQLRECKFDIIKPGKAGAGEYFFYAAGVVVAPTEFVDKTGNKHNLEGKRTTIMEVLYDTPTRSRKTVEDHYVWILNELKKLGVDTSNTTVNDLESITEALKKSKPYFKFRTWAGSKTEIENRGGKFWVGDKGPYATHEAAQAANPYAGKEPMTNEIWGGVCEWQGAEDPGGVDESTDDVDEAATQSAGQPPSKSPTKGTASASDDGDGSALDVADLVALSNKKDKAAQNRLKEMAMARGHSEEVCDATDTWEELAELCSTDPEGKADADADAASAGDPEAAADSDWEPQKGECYFVKLVDPKTKKPAKKGTECEVVAVGAKKRTVKMKRLDTKADVGEFSWDDLSGEA